MRYSKLFAILCWGILLLHILWTQFCANEQNSAHLYFWETHFIQSCDLISWIWLHLGCFCCFSITYSSRLLFGTCWCHQTCDESWKRSSSWCVFYVPLWTKYEFIRFANYCIKLNAAVCYVKRISWVMSLESPVQRPLLSIFHRDAAVLSDWNENQINISDALAFQ